MRIIRTGAFVGLLLIGGCTPKLEYGAGCGCGGNPFAIPGSEQDLVANIGDRVFYNFNSATISSDAGATLWRQSAWLAKYPSVDVLIAGNADERGTETYNLALGERRAQSARNYLLAQGIAASRMKTISYGKDCPIAGGHDEAAYQQNRVSITSVVGNNPQNCR